MSVVNRQWDYFADGRRIAGVRILACVVPAQWQRHTCYRVRHICCGTEVEMGHATIRLRLRAGTTRCRVCQAQVVGRERALSRSAAPEPERGGTDEARAALAAALSVPPLGAVVVNGAWWPKLGRMGARYGSV